MQKKQRTTQLGELIAAAFDEASLISVDPKKISDMASNAVMRVLKRAGKTSILLNRPRYLKMAPVL